MNARATKSTFSSIYLFLAAFAVGIAGGFYLLSATYIAPKLVRDRADAILSVIRSHQEDILLNRPRAVREELLRAGAIAEEQQFSHYLYDEKDKVQPLIEKCVVVAESYCLNEGTSIFFIGNSNSPPGTNFKLAIVLRNNLLSPPAALLLWQGGILIFIALAFLLLKAAISRKERYLLSRLEAAQTAFKRAQLHLAGSEISGDEFDIFEKSANELAEALESYKSQFERKTRLEQLGQTIGQVSHDLKAPLNEAENFLTSLPLLLESASKEDLNKATKSLIQRIRSGKETLSHALKQTAQRSVARQALDLNELLQSVSDRAGKNSKLKGLSFNISSSGDFTALGDQLKLETAILNLFENSSDENPRARISIAVSAGRPGFAKITYEDNAGGIPEDSLGSIFEPLVTFKKNGTGLGLSSTREIIMQHGGEVCALPNNGGAKFEILLPTVGGTNA